MKVFSTINEFRKRSNFAPKAIFIFIALLTMGFLCSLGFWQLQRAEEKRSMLAHFNLMREKPPVLLNDERTLSSIENYQPISVQGYYDAEHVFLLDNQFYQHQLGYEVIEPIKVFDESSNHIILVSLGWIKAPNDRQKLPPLHLPSGKNTIQGTAYFPPQSWMILGANVDNPQSGLSMTSNFWPKRIETLNISEIARLLNESNVNAKVYPFILRLNPEKLSHHYIRDWPIVIMSPQRHLGYAIQWFAMAFTVLIIFIALNLKKK